MSGPPAAPASSSPDPYAWMRDRDSPAMRDYLAAERAHYDRWLGSVRGLRDELAAELTARVIPAEESVSWRRAGHTCFTRTTPGLEYEQFCRAVGREEPAQVLLDENLLLTEDPAAGGYLGLGVREISPDGQGAVRRLRDHDIQRPACGTPSPPGAISKGEEILLLAVLSLQRTGGLAARPGSCRIIAGRAPNLWNG